MEVRTVRGLHEEVVRREEEKGRQIAKLWDGYEMDCLLNPGKQGQQERNAPTDDGEESVLSKDAAAVLEVLRGGDAAQGTDLSESGKTLAYALIAPAFLGQFGEPVTPGKIRAALKAMGFDGMVEVAVFADILTLKEALEFDQHVVTKADFQLTSCCCPVWIAMIRDIYAELMPHVPGAVSPMIAAGRAVKALHPEAVTVFIGPCLAKKREAKEPDIADAVDYVLTFQEVDALFAVTGIQPENFPEDEKEHSSMAGRIYARTGGVSEAVKKTVEQLHPGREIMVQPRQADGVAACREMIEEIKSGAGAANFYEGMACEGGCVGGPRALLPREEGRELVNRYGAQAVYQTPAENPYVIELIEKLGYHTIEDFLEKSDILTRDFVI